MSKTRTPSAFSLGVFFRVVFVRSVVARCVLGVLLGTLVLPALALCPAERFDETVRLARVQDGDTLSLEDGRRVRVLGINAPEVSGRNSTAEPLGQAAKQAAEAFFGKGKTLHLVYDLERQDRYGRLLAHVYDADKRSLAANLLRDGLAMQIAVPPNLSGQDCLQRQEQQARSKQRGIWQHPYWRPRPAASLRLTDTGFLRVRGKVVKVTEGRDIWLELDGLLAVRIGAIDKRLFANREWRHWEGRTLEVRGWIVNRQTDATQKKGFKPLRLDLRSPYGLILE